MVRVGMHLNDMNMKEISEEYVRKLFNLGRREDSEAQNLSC